MVVRSGEAVQPVVLEVTVEEIAAKGKDCISPTKGPEHVAHPTATDCLAKAERNRLLHTAASLQRHSKYLNKHSNIRPTNIFHF